MSTDNKLILSYTIYISLMMVWIVIVWTGTAYIVFWKDHSGWWFVLTISMSCPIMPWKWNRLLTGVKPEEGL